MFTHFPLTYSHFLPVQFYEKSSARTIIFTKTAAATYLLYGEVSRVKDLTKPLFELLFYTIRIEIVPTTNVICI